MSPARVGAGVGAVVIHERALLMILRAGSHGAGVWSVPGGWMEPGESPEETAVREVMEETGVTVAPIPNRLYSLTWPVVDGVAALTVYVPSRYVEGEARVVEPDKCPEVRWVPLGKVADLPLFPHFGEYWAKDWR